VSLAIAESCAHCGSDSLEMRQKTTISGGRLVAYQCTECGRAASAWLKQSGIADVGQLPQWDVELEQRRVESWRETLAQKREKQSEQWWAQYTAYLESAAWRSRRAAVLLRANGCCEGCGLRHATQVHHLSYRNVTREFLWELVAICEPCHERAHETTEEGSL
jgi:hypothetical protein